MAGHRTRDRNPDGSVQPRRASTAATNRHNRSIHEYAGAQSEQERLGEMYRVVCSTAAALRKRDPEAADRIVRVATAALQSAAQQMLTELDRSTSPQRRRGRERGAAVQPTAEPVVPARPRPTGDQLVVHVGGDAVVIHTPTP